MHRSKAIALDGALATAISFGPARMGFGLFLPQFKNAFSITTQKAGFIASASAGFCWSPFNNAAQRDVETRYQGRTLSIISTGTTAGIALAGLITLCVASAEHGWYSRSPPCSPLSSAPLFFHVCPANLPATTAIMTLR